MDKTSTGIAGLDEILYGGILRGSAILVEGTPGAGKTTLGMQFIYEGITRYHEPGLIITFEEVPQQMYRDALNFGWDLRQLSAAGQLKVIPTSPAIFQQQIDSPEGLIQKTLREMDVRRILIDSLTHFQRITSDPIKLRELINRVLNLLRQGEYTTFLIGEVLSQAGEVSFEEYVVDAVFRLGQDVDGGTSPQRFIEVTKARGQDFQGGRHAVAFGPHGMEVYPTPSPPPSPADGEWAIPHVLDRASTGIDGLDLMIGGGFIRGFGNLVAGEPGTGKTSIGLHFLNAGAEQGEAGLIVSLSAKPPKIISLANSIGLRLEEDVATERLRFIHRPPTGLCLNELFLQIREVIRPGQIRRVLFDSLADLEINIANPLRLRDYVYSLMDLFQEHGVTSVFTTGVQSVGADNVRVDPNLAIIVDSILLLRFEAVEARRRKVMTVLKMRGSDHDPGARAYKITPRGLVIGTASAQELFARQVEVGA